MTHSKPANPFEATTDPDSPFCDDGYSFPPVNTTDFDFTLGSLSKFYSLMRHDLVKAARKGKGYFIEADPYELHKLLNEARYRNDYVAIANYAMMLQTIERVEAEKNAWTAAHAKVAEARAKEAATIFVFAKAWLEDHANESIFDRTLLVQDTNGDGIVIGPLLPDSFFQEGPGIFVAMDAQGQQYRMDMFNSYVEPVQPGVASDDPSSY